MYYVYAITTEAEDRIYVGFTACLEKRLSEHNSGKTKSTRHYRPWKMFHIEEFGSRLLGRSREKKLKTGFGKEFLKKILSKRPCSSVG